MQESMRWHVCAGSAGGYGSHGRSRTHLLLQLGKESKGHPSASLAVSYAEKDDSLLGNVVKEPFLENV